ncbi:MAG: hypothetical protein AB7V08_05985 [Elusimicrobiales bacterium]
MNFYNEDEKKADIPVIPGAASPFRKTSAFGKAPMFSRAAGGFVDRLKNLSRRDMAFVAIGLSVLVMAPVAEYMISQPSQDNVLKGNDFAQRHGDAGPFEPGINGLSQGSADGSGEVITPLTSRDPASLILGSQSSQPVLPPAVTAPPSSSWRDAVTDSGRAAFSAASKSVGAPTVIPRMASSLRGFTSFGGDGSSRTSGSLSGGKIIDDAKSASSKAAKRSMIGPVAMAGYKGVATGNPNSASKGAFEKLRGAADKSASNFSGGSAMSSLDKAAADAVQIGAGTGGAGGLGEGDKTKGANNYDNKYKHERSGESLAEMAAKERQKKALEWEFFKKYEIKKTIVKAVVDAFATTLGKFLTGQMESAMGMASSGPPEYVCLTKQDPDKDCFPAGGGHNVIATGVPTRDTKTVEGWMGGNSPCPCKGMRKSDYDKLTGGAPGAPGTPGANPGGTTVVGPGANGVDNPQLVHVQTEDFDGALRDIMMKVKEAVGKKDDQAKLWEYNKAISADVVALMSGRDPKKQLPGVLSAIDRSADMVASSATIYSSNVSDANVKLAEAKQQTDEFVTEVKAILAGGAAMEAYTSKVLGQGKKAVMGKLDSSVETTMRQRLAQAEDWQTRQLESQKDITFHTKALGFFRQQVPAVKNGVVAKLRATGQQINTKAAEVTREMEAFPDETAAELPANKAAIDAAFAKLWNGTDESAVGAIIKLRGATANVTSYELDDAAEVKKEDDTWKTISPVLALESLGAAKDTYAAPQGELSETMIASIKRGRFELPMDIGTLAADPVMIKVGAEGAIAEIAKFRTELKLGATETVTPDPVDPKPQDPKPQDPKPQDPKPQGVTHTASADEVAEAQANIAIIDKVQLYGVGTENGANRCDNEQSNIIRTAKIDSDLMIRDGISTNDVAAIERNMQSVCNVLGKCNRASLSAAGCN